MIMMKSLVQLLVANLDWSALAALVLEETEEGSSQNSEHDDVSDKERNDATGKVDEAFEEVDDKLDDLRGELGSKLGRVFN